MIPLPGGVRLAFRARRHTAFLFAIVVLIVLRPFLGDSAGAATAFNLAFLLVLLVALRTVRIDDLAGERDALLIERRRTSVVAWALAAPAVATRFWLFFSSDRRLIQVALACWLLFFCYIVWRLLQSVLRQREVTGETISMAVSIYLLIGMCWGLLYVVLLTNDPTAFRFGTPLPRGSDELDQFPILLYFSLTTLSTIGFGDITPLTLSARYASVTEGITGQLYLAILVARLVGMQMSRAATRSDRD